MNWPLVIAIGAALVGGGGGLWSAMTIIPQRRKLSAETVSITTDSTLKLVAAIRVDAELVRTEAREARQEVREARIEAREAREAVIAARQEAIATHDRVRSVRNEVEGLAAALSKLVVMIHDPTMTIERLREATEPPTPPVGDA